MYTTRTVPRGRQTRVGGDPCVSSCVCAVYTVWPIDQNAKGGPGASVDFAGAGDDDELLLLLLLAGRGQLCKRRRWSLEPILLLATYV